MAILDLPPELQGLLAQQQTQEPNFLGTVLTSLGQGLSDAGMGGQGVLAGIGAGSQYLAKNTRDAQAIARANQRQQLADALTLGKYNLDSKAQDQQTAYQNRNLDLQAQQQAQQAAYQNGQIGLSRQELAQKQSAQTDKINALKGLLGDDQQAISAVLAGAPVEAVLQSKGIIKVNDTRPAALQIADALDQAQKSGDKTRLANLQAAAKMGLGYSTPTADPTATGDAYLSQLDPARASMVSLIANGGINPATVLSRMSPSDKASILSDVTHVNPGYNANQFGANKEFNTGKLGSQVRSLSVADDHLQTLSGLANALNNGDTQLFNRLGNEYNRQTGGAAPTNFATAKQLVADEVIKAVVGSGGGVADREEAARVIDAANSPEQLRGAIQTYRDLMAGQRNGLKDQYSRSTGKSDFDEVFKSSHQSSKENDPLGLRGGK